MPSPFPGMDPYLEGHLWPDVHQALAYEIRRRLTPLLRPRYLTRLAISTYIDPNPGPEIGIMYPDIEVLKRQVESQPAVTPETAISRTSPAITEPLTVAVHELEVRLVGVDILDAVDNRLVTSIEIVSPVNKREPGLTQFRDKVRNLRSTDVHVMVIDLLRRGTRTITADDIPSTSYVITLHRAHEHFMQVWPVDLTTALPTVAVPLHPRDGDVPLELSAVLTQIYDDAGYDLSINNDDVPPPPALDEPTMTWIRELCGQ